MALKRFLVGLFNGDAIFPFDLETAEPIETDGGAPQAAALYAVDHLLPGEEHVVGVVPDQARFPCAVITFTIVIRPRPAKSL